MPLECPHGDYTTPPGTPHKEVADLLDHLGDHPEYSILKPGFDILAGMMRNLPIPVGQ